MEGSARVTEMSRNSAKSQWEDHGVHKLDNTYYMSYNKK